MKTKRIVSIILMLILIAIMAVSVCAAGTGDVAGAV